MKYHELPEADLDKARQMAIDIQTETCKDGYTRQDLIDTIERLNKGTEKPIYLMSAAELRDSFPIFDREFSADDITE